VAIAPQGDIDVVAQPGGEGDVPAAPEVSEADGCIGKAEVVRESKAQTEGRSDRGDRVAGEVAEDLSTEGQRRDPGIDKAGDGLAVIDLLHDRGKEAVGEHRFLKQTQGHQGQAEAQLIGCGLAGQLKLRNQFGGPHDGSGYQVRKERNKEGVIEEAARRRCTAEVDVQGVRHGGEGIERDADGQHNTRLWRGVFESCQRCQVSEVLDQEVAVFEVAEETQTDGDGEEHPGAAPPGVVCLREAARGEPVDYGRYPEEDHKGRVPCCVEDVAGDEEVDFLHPPREGHRVQDENDGKEDNEDE
jgi:hypothetical protein